MICVRPSREKRWTGPVEHDIPLKTSPTFMDLLHLSKNGRNFTHF